MAALLVLLDKAIKPLLAAAQPIGGSRPPQNPAPRDIHHQAIRASMRGGFPRTGDCCMNGDNDFSRLRL